MEYNYECDICKRDHNGQHILNALLAMGGFTTVMKIFQGDLKNYNLCAVCAETKGYSVSGPSMFKCVGCKCEHNGQHVLLAILNEGGFNIALKSTFNFGHQKYQEFNLCRTCGADKGFKFDTGGFCRITSA